MRGSAMGSGDHGRLKGAAGFSLIELMVALAVASLVYSMAMPGYRHAVLKANRIAGKGVLLDVMARQERYFIDHSRYAPSLPDLGLPEPYLVDGRAQPAPGGRSVYSVELVWDGEEFLGAQAVPRNRQRQDAQCMTFTLRPTGARAVSGTLSARPYLCW